MPSLYPLKFKTIFKDKIWGGDKIKTKLGKDFSPLPNCGETWEISGVKGNVSEVNEGSLKGKNLNELIAESGEKLLGKKVVEKYGKEFPLLIKFIDANDDLSIQVHPDDSLAKKRHNSFGKTEMWYIIQADNGARLASGFNKPTSSEEYLQHLNSGRLHDLLNVEEVKADDVFYLPAGRVHYIGKGVMLAEIQQTSDITYRIYDFDRVDDKGNKRELHTNEALEAIDYTFYDQYKTRFEKKKNEIVPIVTSPYFKTNSIHLDKELKRNYNFIDSFIILICLEGKSEIKYAGGKVSIKLGEAILIPAEIKELEIIPSGFCKIIETYVP